VYEHVLGEEAYTFVEEARGGCASVWVGVDACVRADACAASAPCPPSFIFR
jgi:hypothetical protein